MTPPNDATGPRPEMEAAAYPWRIGGPPLKVRSSPYRVRRLRTMSEPRTPNGIALASTRPPAAATRHRRTAY